MTEHDSVTVTRNDDAGRYEVAVNGELAGFTEFSPNPRGQLRFPHTEVFEQFGGRGLATTLVRDALADVAARGEEIIPLCPFVVKYIASNEVSGLKVVSR